MRKIFLASLVTLTVAGANAQKLDDVQKALSENKYDQAKAAIDKAFTDPKAANNPQAWYYKGKVYTGLAMADSTGSLTYDASGEALNAFKKYQELEPKNTLMLLEQNVGLFQLYDLHYNRGIKAYNAKEYDKAFNHMKKALEVESYTQKKGFSYNGFSFPAMDTTLTNYAASAAYLAKKEDESIPYFEQLANLRLKDKEYKEVYALLAEYHMKKGNAAKADQYLKLGRELYNEPDYWTSVEFGNIPTADKDKRLARYEQMTQKYPNDGGLMLDYAIELFNYTYGNGDNKPADYAVRQEKTGKVLQQALALNQTALGNYVMSQHVYNQIFELDDQLRAVKGTDAAANNKRKDIRAKTDVKFEEMAKHSQAAYDMYVKDEASLKSADKANYRRVINQLIDYHTRKKQMDKVAFYQEKLKNVKM